MSPPYRVIRRLACPRALLHHCGDRTVILGAHLPEEPLLWHGGRLRLRLVRIPQMERHRAVCPLQSALHAIADAVKHIALVQKAHLCLCRMNIDINQMLRHRQMQHARRIASDHERIAVRLLKGSGHGLRAHMPPVDKENLIAAVAAGGVRLRDIARERVFLIAAVHLGHLLRGRPAHHGIDRAVKASVPCRMKLLLSVPEDAEGNLRMRKGKPLHHTQKRGSLHGVALHKLHACGRIIEKITDNDRRPVRAADLSLFGHDTGIQMQPRAECRVGGFCHQIDSGDGGDRRQRLTAEAEGVNGFQIARLAELARRVAQKGGGRVLGAHAAAVVGHAQKGHAAVLYFHGNIFCTRVNGVFDQLLCRACGTVHDLTRRDQVRHMGRKLLNFRHDLTSVRASPQRRPN